MIIYRLTTPDNKCWIGQSKTTLEKRLVQHIQVWKKLKRRKESYRNSCAKLFCAFDNFDPEIEGNWTNEVIFEPTSHEEMDEKEIHFIEFYDSIANGYNITMGGQGIKKEFLDAEQKQNMSIARTEWFETEEGKQWKIQLSERNSGNNNPMFGKVGPNKGKIWTEESKQKLSNSKKGKPGTFTGRKHKDSSIEKARQAAIENHANGMYDYKAMAEMRVGFHQPESQKIKVAAALSKEYDFFNPQGKHVHITNLLGFCRDNGLDQGNMLRVHSGAYKSCKGWRKHK